MHAIRIQTTEGDLNFHYKSRAAAQDVFDPVIKVWRQQSEPVCVSDDYNREAVIHPVSIISVVLNDYAQEVECSVDIAILQREAQVKADNRTKASPLLRAGTMFPAPRQQ